MVHILYYRVMRIRQTIECNIEAGDLSRDKRIDNLAQWLILPIVYQFHSIMRCSSNDHSRRTDSAAITQAHTLNTTIAVFNSLNACATHNLR